LPWDPAPHTQAVKYDAEALPRLQSACEADRAGGGIKLTHYRMPPPLAFRQRRV